MCHLLIEGHWFLSRGFLYLCPELRRDLFVCMCMCVCVFVCMCSCVGGLESASAQTPLKHSFKDSQFMEILRDTLSSPGPSWLDLEVSGWSSWGRETSSSAQEKWRLMYFNHWDSRSCRDKKWVQLRDQLEVRDRGKTEGVWDAEVEWWTGVRWMSGRGEVSWGFPNIHAFRTATAKLAVLNRFVERTWNLDLGSHELKFQFKHSVAMRPGGTGVSYFTSLIFNSVIFRRRLMIWGFSENLKNNPYNVLHK